MSIATFVGTLGALSCGGELVSSSPAAPTTDPAGLVGNPAPEFRAHAEKGNGAALSTRELRGHVVVLDFWATYCAPCKASFPKLEQLNAKYAASGLSVVGISEDEPEDKPKVQSFAAAYGARFAIAWDGDKAIARAYRPETMPSTFVIDRKGVVRYAHVGFREGDEIELEREVQELLAH
jgi:peroxiredoxin